MMGPCAAIRAVALVVLAGCASAPAPSKAWTDTYHEGCIHDVFYRNVEDWVRIGLYTAQQKRDVLAARRLLWSMRGEIPVDYQGMVGCTIEGKLVFASGTQGIMDALCKANPPGRLGYFEPAPMVRNRIPGTSDHPVPPIGRGKPDRETPVREGRR